MKLEIKHPSIPSDLLSALERKARFLSFTRPNTVYYCVESGYDETLVGVFGDGANGAYEWFIWDGSGKTLRTSDVGYGCVGVALCRGLVESGAETSNGDHDLVLSWSRKERSRE